MKPCFRTSESVTEGHPDKICDQISDGILDAYLKKDPLAHVAIETMVSRNLVVIAGEVNSTGSVDVETVARKIIAQIGYIHPGKGFDANTCLILTNINKQSEDIAIGVKHPEDIGGGDQGMMYGYACNEAPGLIPQPFYFANQLVLEAARLRKNGVLPWLGPDGKAQVTMKYDADTGRSCIAGVVLSMQHEDLDISYVRNELENQIVRKVIPADLLCEDARVFINPTGRFVIGGPAGDTGVTGRKIMVDSYGGLAKHGGGAFSGKDATKVDRAAAYMARYAAKNVVAAGLADRCEVSVAYVIGQTEPVAVEVNAFGTEKIPLDVINKLVKEHFSFKVADIIGCLKLRTPIFLETAKYGHFGREDQGFLWELTNKAALLRSLAAHIPKRIN